MTRKAQRFTTNLALKIAIVSSAQKQCDVAQRTRIPETRLSNIVRGRQDATPAEQRRLAKVLQCDPSALFPSAEPVEAEAGA